MSITFPLHISVQIARLLRGEDTEPEKEEVSVEGRAATPAFGARALRPYVPLRCSPERERARDGYPLPSTAATPTHQQTQIFLRFIVLRFIM